MISFGEVLKGTDFPNGVVLLTTFCVRYDVQALFRQHLPCGRRQVYHERALVSGHANDGRRCGSSVTRHPFRGARTRWRHALQFETCYRSSTQSAWFRLGDAGLNPVVDSLCHTRLELQSGMLTAYL